MRLAAAHRFADVGPETGPGTDWAGRLAVNCCGGEFAEELLSMRRRTLWLMIDFGWRS